MTGHAAAALRKSSTRLLRVVEILLVGLAALLVLERFGWLAPTLARKAPLDTARLAGEAAAAAPELVYLLALWWIRRALAALAKGELDAPVIPPMLRRVGLALACGAGLQVFVAPGVERLVGHGPPYWVAFDVGGLVLGAVGLSLAILARLLERGQAARAELDEMF